MRHSAWCAATVDIGGRSSDIYVIEAPAVRCGVVRVHRWWDAYQGPSRSRNKDSATRATLRVRAAACCASRDLPCRTIMGQWQNDAATEGHHRYDNATGADEHAEEPSKRRHARNATMSHKRNIATHVDQRSCATMGFLQRICQDPGAPCQIQGPLPDTTCIWLCPRL